MRYQQEARTRHDDARHATVAEPRRGHDVGDPRTDDRPEIVVRHRVTLVVPAPRKWRVPPR